MQITDILAQMGGLQSMAHGSASALAVDRRKGSWEP